MEASYLSTGSFVLRDRFGGNLSFDINKKVDVVVGASGGYGIPGQSMDELFRLCAFWLPQFRSINSIVINEVQDLAAIEVIDDYKFTHVPLTTRKYKKDLVNWESFWSGWNEGISPRIHAHKVGRAIKSLSRRRGCKSFRVIESPYESPVGIDELDLLGTGVLSVSPTNREPDPAQYVKHFISDFEQEEYERNLKLHPDVALYSDIRYTVNEYQFRAPKMSKGTAPQGGVLCLGCSYTFGYGVDDAYTWPQIFSKHTGEETLNVSMLGGSNDTIYRLGHAWIPRVKPKAVIALFTHEARKENYQLDPVCGEGHYMANPILPNRFVEPNRLYVDLITNRYNLYMNYLQNRMALEDLCFEHNIPLIAVPVEALFHGGRGDHSFARDMSHPSPWVLNDFVEKCILPRWNEIVKNDQ